MTKRLPSGPPCFDPTHGHVFLARRRPLDVDEDYAPRRRRRLRHDDSDDFYITAWLCPVRHELSVVIEDEREIEPDRATGGPLGEL